MNAIKSACMVTLLVTRGMTTNESVTIVSRMDDMTDDECVVALRAHGLDKVDACILVSDASNIANDIFENNRSKSPIKAPSKARKAVRRTDGNGQWKSTDVFMDEPKPPVMLDAILDDNGNVDSSKVDDVMRDTNREWTAEEILRREG